MFHTILVCSDGSNQALQSARSAMELAQRFKAKVLLLHVFDDSNLPHLHEELAHLIERTHHEVEDRTGAIFIKTGVPFEPIHEVGDQVDTILVVAARQHADLIVLGSRGLSEWEELLLGSVSDGVLLSTSCPLLIVRGKHSGFHKILLATDGTEGAQKATSAAIKLTKEFGSELKVLTVYDPVRSHLSVPPDELGSDSYLWRVRAAVMTKVKDAAEKEGVPYAFEQIVGKPAEVIVRYARENQSDLIVMGGHGATMLRSLLVGSESRQVAHHAPCPVLFVP
jgi:nucleotide-binding universal stress UspA family protein